MTPVYLRRRSPVDAHDSEWRKSYLFGEWLPYTEKFSYKTSVTYADECMKIERFNCSRNLQSEVSTIFHGGESLRKYDDFWPTNENQSINSQISVGCKE